MNRMHYYKLLFFTVVFSPLKVIASNETIPSMAFLEYLAEMKEVDGELIGPQDLQTSDCVKLTKIMNEKNNNIRSKNQQEIGTTNLANENISNDKEECKNDV